MKHDVDPLVTIGGLIVLVIIGAVAAALRSSKDAARRKHIFAKYGQTELATRIADKVVWTGETPEQLCDSLGRPLAIDHHALKAKTREVWKYDSRGKNRFGVRVTIEDGVVVGWDAKQ